MSSQLGYIPKDIKSVSNGLQVPLDGNTLYAAPIHLLTATVEATAAAVTYSPQVILGGVILRDPNGGARTDVLPTAALLVAATKGAVVGTAVRLIVRNTADAAETITMSVGTGITSLAGNTLTIAQSATAEYLLLYTNVTPGSEAVTLITINSANTH